MSASPPPPPLRCAHTSRFPALLSALGASVLVSTDRAGKLIVLRADGGVFNTHFRGLDRPRGLAVQPHRLAVSTATAVWEYHDVPAAAASLEPAGRHDACFLPLRSHVTGDVQARELAWAGDELWVVNTRFSCLCTLDLRYSFVPRWLPPFITALAPEDRCHLNGLAVAEGRPRFVTALAASDAPAGWRQHKRDGGVVLDVASGEVVCSGLSMPHSPRWHADRLWLLEVGTATVGVVDQPAGRCEAVAELPGLPRGLAFHEGHALVGLSRSGLPALVGAVRSGSKCGVWVLAASSGRTVAWLELEGSAEGVFAVEVLPGQRFPELLHEQSSRVADSFVLPDEPCRGSPPGGGLPGKAAAVIWVISDL